MLQKVGQTSVSPGGGLVTLPNFFALKPDQTPNCMNVKYDIGGMVEKRLGVTSLNTTAISGGVAGSNTGGFGAFDFGAGNAGGVPLRWLINCVGTGIVASSNRGLTWVVIATDRRAGAYQSFERNRSFLIATADTRQQVLYWAGSVGTFMLTMPVGSAPSAKYSRHFQGFLFLMNDSSNSMLMTYAPDTDILTDAWTNTFQLPGSPDDEITGSEILGKRLYVFSKYRTYKISHVGGNPDFAYQEVKGWGAVPNTIERVTLPQEGEVIVALGWDKKLRIFDGADDKIISDPIEQNNGLANFYLNNININAITKSFAEVDTNEQTYKLGLVLGASSDATFMLCWNYRTGAFYPYDGQLMNRIIMADSANTRALMGFGRDNFVYHMDSGNRDQATAVNEFLDSPLIFNKSPSTVTKGQKVNFYFGATSSGTIYFQDRTDYASSFDNRRDMVTLSDTTNLIQVKKTVDIPLTYNTYQYRVSSSSSTANPWRLTRIDYENVTLGVGEG